MVKKISRILIITFSLTFLIFCSLAYGTIEIKKGVNNQCFKCHGAVGLTDRNSQGEKTSIYINEAIYNPSIHGNQPCQICHQNVNQYPHNYTKDYNTLKKEINERCMQCHSDITAEYKNSIHYKDTKEGRNAYCSDCHSSHSIFKKQDKRALSYTNNVPKTCTKCHKHNVLESYEESFHGKAISLGSKKAASCNDCHGSHKILTVNSVNSPVNKQNVPGTCAKCHFNARANFAEGIEHYEMKGEGEGAPMYYTFKFFTWLTIITCTLLFIHIELELYRLYKNTI